MRKTQKEWRKANPEYAAKWKSKKPKAYFKEHIGKIDQEKRRKRVLARWHKMADEGFCGSHTARLAVRRGACEECRLTNNLRSRLKHAVRNNSKKAGSAVRDLGCTILEFRSYIEALWEPGMSWSNWGRGPGTWQIDHRRPLASFDLTQREQVREACLFINLQPLWMEANSSKGGREVVQ